jgi:hypothetical protein
LPLISGIGALDGMLGGLVPGELVLLTGDASTSALSHLLAVRSQMPEGSGGLSSTVVWLDGGNTFDPYSITELSKELGLDPERILRRIYISRAFTCHQMSSLVLEKLWVATGRFRSKFIVTSDLPRLYLESDIPGWRSPKAFLPVAEELRTSPVRRDVLILVTSLEHPFSGGKDRMHDILISSADVVAEVRKRKGGVEAKIRKHPSGKTGRILLGDGIPGAVTLDEFLGGEADG